MLGSPLGQSRFNMRLLLETMCRWRIADFSSSITANSMFSQKGDKQWDNRRAKSVACSGERRRNRVI